MYDARRSIAGPATTFSAIAASRKPTGAMISTSPRRRHRRSVTPRTPPKWSTWLWV